MRLVVVFYGILNAMECVINSRIIFFIILNSCTTYRYSEIEISPMYVNLGRIKIGSENNTYLTIQNSSSRDLNIMEIQSSCDCTIPGIRKLTIPENSIYKLNILYSPTSLGEQVQTITIKSNSDPPFNDFFIFSEVIN